MSKDNAHAWFPSAAWTVSVEDYCDAVDMRDEERDRLMVFAPDHVVTVADGGADLVYVGGEEQDDD